MKKILKILSAWLEKTFYRTERNIQPILYLLHNSQVKAKITNKSLQQMQAAIFCSKTNISI